MSMHSEDSSQEIVISQAYQTTDSGEPWAIPDEESDRPLPSMDSLVKAALATHRVCQASAFTHSFFGGFELAVLGSPRGTKDVDVEIARPNIRTSAGAGTYERIYAAFKNDPDFMVIEGTNSDGGFRTIWRYSVGVTVHMRGPSRLPRKLMFLPLGPPLESLKGRQTQLPFFKPKHLLTEKLLSAGERQRRVDALDIVWLMRDFEMARSNSRNTSHVPSIELGKVKRLIADADIEKARGNHGDLLAQPLAQLLAAS